MIDALDRLEREAIARLAAVETEEALAGWQRDYVGRRGAVTEAVKVVGSLPPEKRPTYGRRANEIKQALEVAYDARASELEQEQMARRLAADALDVTLPGRAPDAGRLHPVTAIMRRMRSAFAQMGFQVYEGRDVETEEYNFTLLNMPPYHPARDSHDSFYATQAGTVLRTHTSPAQVRVMRQRGAPLRVVVPGACYRYDQPDASHNFMFHQMEGLAVGPSVRMTDLLGTIRGLARLLFGREIRLRFVGGHFPFTEPSIETFVQCTVCGGGGCQLCKGSGWVEAIPGGMVHPVVLRNGGIDPTRHTGFAFGAGVDRIAALWYRVPDIRMLLENDLRFLEQF